MPSHEFAQRSSRLGRICAGGYKGFKRGLRQYGAAVGEIGFIQHAAYNGATGILFKVAADMGVGLMVRL